MIKLSILRIPKEGNYYLHPKAYAFVIGIVLVL